MAMPGRTFSASREYRYGFNGKENDKDAGEGVQDYGMRISDNRLGRFLSEDPITKKYPELTPYQFASNRPIDGIDEDGLEHMRTIPRFENSGQRTWIDYVSEFDNAVIDLVNLVPSTWNAGVNTVKSIMNGTLVKDFKNEAAGVGTALKGVGTNLATKPLTTLTSPEALNFITTSYIGAKAFTIGGNAKNLISPTTSTVVEEQVTLYRGVNEGHVDFAAQSKGIVKPNGGSATPLEHNTVSTFNSPFTSWTPDIDVATNSALRPKGSGVVLEVKVPKSKTVASPNQKTVKLKHKPSEPARSESEVLLKGKVKVSAQNIKKVG